MSATVPLTDTVTLHVDGREITVPKGTSLVVAAAEHAGVEIPVFCYEPRLGPPIGACRMCLVEIEGTPKLQAACTLSCADGMVVKTAETSEQAKEAHRAGIDDFHVADLASVLHVNVAAEEEGCVDCDEHRFGTKVGCARRQQLLIGARRGVDECRAVLRDGFSFGEQAEPLDAFCPELVGGPTRKGVVAEHDHAVGVAAHGDDRVGLLP